MPELSVAGIEAFIRENQSWAALIVGALCFLRALVIVGLFVPATALLLAAGGMVGAGLVSLGDLVLAGVIGSQLGDHLSFGIGRGLGPGARQVWPMRTRPDLVEAGEAFFLKHGWWGVFVSRFFSLLRVTVPSCAGILRMHYLQFAIVSLASAAVFVPLVLSPGALLGLIFSQETVTTIMTVMPVAFMFVTPVLVAGYLIWRRFAVGRTPRRERDVA